MKRVVLFSFALVTAIWSCREITAFCGFYVAKADTQLFNEASKVVLVRDGERTVLTMANDFKGDPREFAIVIPVPTVIQKDQIRVSNRGLFDHIDAYSAPRLVDVVDPNPCLRFTTADAIAAPGVGGGRGGGGGAQRARALGVTIEAQYSVGEYDILILSAEQSTGLQTWLTQNGYRIPRGATAILDSYIRQNMKFFVARANLAEQSRLGFSILRPIQVTFQTPKFMLPIRLGMVNADGPQELFVFAISQRGRVETTNYRTVKLPTSAEIPNFVRNRFADFYKDMFSEQVRRENMNTIFTEYAWNMGSCDPCAANPLSADELGELGASNSGGGFPAGPGGRGGAFGQNSQLFLTRLHLRYDNAHFPEDLVFQETADRVNFQTRFILRQPYTGPDQCQAMSSYRDQLPQRHETEARTLQSLTGWTLADIRRQMGL
jgi:hypothetical protein